MKLFSIFNRQLPSQSAGPEPPWKRREAALVWGAPLVLFPALAFIPVTVSLILQPGFPHARLLGGLLLPLLVTAMACGISRLAFCLHHEFDVLSFFAGGTVVVLIVVSMCAGVVLASTIAS